MLKPASIQSTEESVDVVPRCSCLRFNRRSLGVGANMTDPTDATGKFDEENPANRASREIYTRNHRKTDLPTHPHYRRRRGPSEIITTIAQLGDLNAYNQRVFEVRSYAQQWEGAH